MVGGLGLLFGVDWWKTVTTFVAIFSSILFLVLWNGKFKALSDQGGVGMLINLTILIVINGFNWPA
jgi:hypothetical protein